VLKGVEIQLPKGSSFFDHTGTARDKIRARWWTNNPDPEGESIKSMVFPPRDDLPEGNIAPEVLEELPGYEPYGKPLFIGHYYKSASGDPLVDQVPETENLFCLDFSAATTGPLASYRWNEGDTAIVPEHFVTLTH